MEAFFSGYCRQIDASRTVMAEDDEADCLYPDCPYTPSCPIAEKVSQYRDKITPTGQD